jgi:hypothetical protein
VGMVIGFPKKIFNSEPPLIKVLWVFVRGFILIQCTVFVFFRLRCLTMGLLIITQNTNRLIAGLPSNISNSACYAIYN